MIFNLPVNLCDLAPRTNQNIKEEISSILSRNEIYVFHTLFTLFSQCPSGFNMGSQISYPIAEVHDTDGLVCISLRRFNKVWLVHAQREVVEMTCKVVGSVIN